MSEVKIFSSFEISSGNSCGRWVHYEEFERKEFELDAARNRTDVERLRADTAEAARDTLRDKLELSERDRMAAERRYEEMAKARDCIATNYNQLSYGASICKEKLAAAEQRIAEMKKALESIKYRLEVFIEDDHAMMPASLEVTLGIADSALNPNPEAGSHE